MKIESGELESEAWDRSNVRLRMRYGLADDAIIIEVFDEQAQEVTISVEEFIKFLPSALRKRLIDTAIDR